MECSHSPLKYAHEKPTSPSGPTIESPVQLPLPIWAGYIIRYEYANETKQTTNQVAILTILGLET
jgi:hypothetical protein